ncbi:hypothetical protein Dda_9240 [Drechslerella dactyloides]|uniref:CENP-V/GFA domain-containing protein n=1 Tax=Drechslerella dactyloides TaxID=74499 RepID=A0AAD6IQH4_DREDA|nr:hypothetical protein Dda_9240 [Drechslerella dactyloides]
MEASDSAMLKLACHCGSNTHAFSVTLPLDKKYKDIHFCQCTTCRWATGTFAATAIQAPSPPFDPDGNPPATLTVWKSSDIGSRYFCSTCSAQLFFRYSLPELTKDANRGFYLATGVVELPPGETFGVDCVAYIDSVPDGGLASWLSDVKLRGLLRDTLAVDDIVAREREARNLEVPQKLEGTCYCSSVKITLSRPTGRPEELPPYTFSDNTDLVIPNYTPADEQPAVDEKNPWWIREEQKPAAGKRFLGGLCACTSCRKIAGSEVQGWIFVPTVCVELTLPSGETVPWPSRQELVEDPTYNSIIGTYKSTPGDPGVLRGFCKTCGANIFWDGLTRRNLVDLSTGLFSQRGVREEGWIEWWTERVSFVEDAEKRHDIGKRLERGLQEWKTRLGGRV